MPRIITGPGGRQLHIGGRRRPGVPHGLKLHEFKLDLSQWPATPDSVDYGAAPAAQPCLTNICKNDTLGCCTTADRFHRQAMRQAAAGLPVYNPSDADVIAIYSRDGGYNGTPASDQGCDEVTVLTNAQQKGIPCAAGATDQITGFLVIDVSNWDLVRAAISMFVGASICMELPTAWVEPFPSGPGWTWDIAGNPNPSNGHCYSAAGQRADGLPCWSWGMPCFVTKAAIQAYATDSAGGALYVEVDRQMLLAASQKAPDGADWAAIIAAFDDAGGTVPTPAPSSGAKATLANAIAAITTSINAGDPLQTRQQSIDAASAALAQLTGWPAS